MRYPEGVFVTFIFGLFEILAYEIDNKNIFLKQSEGTFFCLDYWQVKVKMACSLDLLLLTLMPGPCSGKHFDINFGNRLYSKEKRPGSPLLF